MGRIPDHVIEEVRERSDLVAIVRRHVTLKRSGNRHWGLCPFHDEKTPSFQVLEDRGIFHCFGCDASGDVFAFRMRHDGLDFPDAVRALAREAGIEVPVSSQAESGRTSKLYASNEAALEFFRASLRSPAGAAARRYLEERGVDEELRDRFQIGFAPPGWDGLYKHLSARGSEIDVAEQVGLLGRRQTGDGHYDRFRGRIIFPIVEPSGYTVGFGGRVLGSEDTPKYLNSQENPIYHKGRVLFGLALALDAIRGRGRVVVAEGYFDLVALHRAGIEECVAPCGTAMTLDHARRLRRYASEVVLLFDGDDAGVKAAQRALPLLMSQGLRVRVALLREGDDPDTLLAREGADALRSCVDRAEPLLDRLLDERIKGMGGHAWKVADAAHAVAPLLRALVDPVERAAYTRTVAQRLDVSQEALEKLLAQGDSRERAAPGDARTPTPPPERPSCDAVTRTLLASLAFYPELAPVLDDLESGWLPGETERELVERFRKELAQHGEQALAHLLSPAAEALPENLRAQFALLAAEARPRDLRAAERVARDCIARLGIRKLDQESRKLSTRLESCNDPEALESLLLEKQRKLAERRKLWSQIQQV